MAIFGTQCLAVDYNHVFTQSFSVMIKVALYSWPFALGSGAGVGMRGSISARVAAL